MYIKQVNVYTMNMTLKTPFVTSFGTVHQRKFLVTEVIAQDDTVGWGEGVAFEAPSYTEETVETMAHMLRDFLIPMILHKEIKHPDEVYQLFAPIRRNAMAKSALEGAIWDIYAQQTKQSLAQAIGGTQRKIAVGVSIGMKPTTFELLETIQRFLDEGYQRIKLKIKPGSDVEVIRHVRERFPDLPLMVDANSAYTLEDLPTLKQLDAYNLLMIEQPLATDDIVDHAKLQQAIQTPICLDESICSFEDARRAIELGSCQVINIKIARVGGISEAKRIHDYCQERGIAVWCGGMLEAGIGRAHCVAITSLPHFTLPGDTAASSNYWEEDLIQPEVVVDKGYIHVPQQIGTGYQVDRERIKKYAIKKEVFQ